jgi:FkbM family methyltransferase
MYQSHRWWFPDQDTHFAKMLARNIEKGGQAVYQEPVRRASIPYCKKHDVALDIGANIGLWARDLCQFFQQVHAVEPVADFRDCLIKNVPATNLKIYDCALGAENSMIDMIVVPENTGHSHVDTESFGRGKIQMRTLDSMDLPPADYIKLDCEGYEYNIILGGENYIKSCKPVIVVEQKFHKDTGTSDNGEAVELLMSWGAKLLQQKKHDLIMGWGEPLQITNSQAARFLRGLESR